MKERKQEKEKERKKERKKEERKKEKSRQTAGQLNYQYLIKGNNLVYKLVKFPNVNFCMKKLSMMNHEYFKSFTSITLIYISIPMFKCQTGYSTTTN